VTAAEFVVGKLRASRKHIPLEMKLFIRRDLYSRKFTLADSFSGNAHMTTVSLIHCNELEPV
jgi:hypothetical protein